MNCFVEAEVSARGEIGRVATIFLKNRRCPWRCVMCDLARFAVDATVPPGEIPRQIDEALAALPPARDVKLYNAGSFFDPGAIPPGDYEAIARRVAGFERVIVECHPALVGDACLRFRDLLAGRLEVAMGLETVHPEVLPKLNKGMTLEQFSGAARLLVARGIDVRAFVLVQPPFMRPEEAVHWACRSLDFAFDCGASVTTLIRTRGVDPPPPLEWLAESALYGLALKRGRVFVDLWELPESPWTGRLRRMNLTQAAA